MMEQQDNTEAVVGLAFLGLSIASCWIGFGFVLRYIERRVKLNRIQRELRNDELDEHLRLMMLQTLDNENRRD